MEKRGSIYIDNSLKGYKGSKPIYHQCYRAEITIAGKRYRKRDKSKEQLRIFLDKLIFLGGLENEKI